MLTRTSIRILPKQVEAVECLWGTQNCVKCDMLPLEVSLSLYPAQLTSADTHHEIELRCGSKQSFTIISLLKIPPYLTSLGKHWQSISCPFYIQSLQTSCLPPEMVVDLQCEEEFMMMMVRKEVFDMFNIPLASVHLKNSDCKVSEHLAGGAAYLGAKLTKENHTTCGSLIQVRFCSCLFHCTKSSGEPFVKARCGGRM